MIILHQFTEADFDQLIAWVNSPELLLQFSGVGFIFPLTTAQLAENCAATGRSCYKVALTATGDYIGYCEIFMTPQHKAMLCRILVGDEKLRGQKLGQHIVTALLHIAFTEKQAIKAGLNVYDWNTAAIKCYENAGFRVEPGNIRYVNAPGGGQWIVWHMQKDKPEDIAG